MNTLKRYGKMRDDVTAMCVSLLNDKSGSIKFNAVELLGEIGNTSHISALEVLENNNDDRASGAAKKAIEKIKERTKK
jgi:hypothetical protein